MPADRPLRLTLRLPEGVAFSYVLAGPFTRFMSWFIDFAVVVAAWMALRWLFGVVSLVSDDFAKALAILLYFALSIFYTISLEWFWDGQTLGKRLFKLRVMDAEGLRLRFNQVLLRNLLRFVDALPAAYVLGGASASFSLQGRRLGDLAAGTVVIRESQPPIPDWVAAQSPKFNSLRRHRSLVARLRQNTAPGEAAVALRALLRRGSLESQSRVALFFELARHFKSKAPFADEVLEGISDEQFIRNVVDILYVSEAITVSRSKAA